MAGLGEGAGGRLLVQSGPPRQGAIDIKGHHRGAQAPGLPFGIARGRVAEVEGARAAIDLDRRY